jgi:hypothetical protein
MIKDKKQAIKLLLELIEASCVSTTDFDMHTFFRVEENIFDCKTSCCLCGDLALSRLAKDYGCEVSDIDYISDELEENLANSATDIANELAEVLGRFLARSIYAESYFIRSKSAGKSDIAIKLLDHPHLTTESCRADAIDYIERVIEEIKAL